MQCRLKNIKKLILFVAFNSVIKFYEIVPHVGWPIISSYFAEVSSDHSSSDEQFNNAETGISSCGELPGCSFQEETSSYKATPGHAEVTTEVTSCPSSSTGPVKVENTDAFTSREAPKPNNSVRRNRNALLNSLANFNKGLVTESDSRNEIKTYSRVQDHNSSCDRALTPTGTVPGHFKNKSKFSLTTQNGGIKSARGFELRDEEFPPL
jgi:hypothetical protein